MAGKPFNSNDQLVPVVFQVSSEATSPSAIADVPPTDRRDPAWDVRHGPRNYAALVGAQAASAVLSFAAVWLATRVLGPTGYGGVVAIIAASQAIGQLAVNWTSVSLSRYGVEEFVETGRVAKAFWTRFWIFLPNVLLVVGTSPLWLPPLASLLKLPPEAYLFVLGHFLANALWIHVQQALQGAKLMRRQGLLLTLERLLVFLVILAFALAGNDSFLAVALAYVLAPLGAAAAGLWSLGKLILPVSGFDRVLLRRMVAFSLPILPASLIGYMSTNYLDTFFIAHYLAGSDMGVYGVAYQLSGTALQFPLLAGALLMPLFVTLGVSGRDQRITDFVSSSLPSLTLLWGMTCAAMAFVGGFLLPIVFGANFKAAADLLWPLMAAAAIAGPVQMAYNPIAHARSATYITMVASIAAASTNLTLNVLLIPRFGLIGCAWATTLAYAVHVIIEVFWIHARLLSMHTWTLQALLPIVLGAAWAFRYGSGVMAFLVTLTAAALLSLFHRTDISKSLVTLNGYRRRTPLLIRRSLEDKGQVRYDDSSQV